MNYIFEWIGLLGIIICAIMLLWMHGGSWLIKTFIPNMLKPLIGKKPSFTIMCGSDKDYDDEFTKG